MHHREVLLQSFRAIHNFTPIRVFKEGFSNLKGKLISGYNRHRGERIAMAELTPAESISIYRNVLNRIQNTADQTLAPDQQHGLMLRFLDSLPLEGMLDILELHSYQRLYRMFFFDWLFLDYRSKPGIPTMAELTLHNLKGTLGQPEQLALINLTKSYISPYRILSLQNGHGHLENLILPKSSYRITYDFEGLMVGDILITRLLPGPGPSQWLFFEPWILLMPINDKLFVKSLHQVMKKAGYRKRDFSCFCKEETIQLLQVINQEIAESERDVAEMVESIPFCPDWQETAVNDHQRIIDLLTACNACRAIEGGKEGSFLFCYPEHRERLTWSYILVEDGRIAVCVPPQEDFTPVLDVLEQALTLSGETLEFIRADSTHEQMAHYNDRMLEDLSCLLQNHEEMINDILLPCRHKDVSEDYSRSDFFTKLSFLLGEKLQKES